MNKDSGVKELEERCVAATAAIQTFKARFEFDGSDRHGTCCSFGTIELARQGFIRQETHIAAQLQNGPHVIVSDGHTIEVKELDGSITRTLFSKENASQAGTMDLNGIVLDIFNPFNQNLTDASLIEPIKWNGSIYQAIKYTIDAGEHGTSVQIMYFGSDGLIHRMKVGEPESGFDVILSDIELNIPIDLGQFALAGSASPISH